MDEVDMFAAFVSQAKIRFTNRSGYSPAQRVFGEDIRLPGCLLSDDIISPEMLNTTPSAEYQRAQSIRQAAMQATVSLSDLQTFEKALKSRMRKGHQELKDGEIVFIWRRVSVRQPDGSIDYK
eukprot:2853022-Pyramimonas_sp.AAC.1